MKVPSQGLLAAALAIAGIAITIWMILTPPKSEPRLPVEFTPVVRTHRVALSDERIPVYSHGTVTPAATFSFLAEVGGRVVNIAPQMTDGEFFKMGDKLIQIERRAYELEVTKAHAAVESARLRLAQAQALTRTGTMGGLELTPLARGEPQLADAESALEAALAGLELAEMQLSRTEVVATFDGRVKRRLVQIGQYVAPGTPLAEAYSIDKAEVRLPVTYEQMALLPNFNAPNAAGHGLEVELRDPEGGAVWEGSLLRAQGEVDATTGLTYIIAEVNDPYGTTSEDPAVRTPLIAGSYVEARILGREFKNIAVVPRDAVLENDRVWIVDESGRLRSRKVGVLYQGKATAYIVSGLAPGENVLLTKLDSPVEGQRVRVSLPANASATSSTKTRVATP